MFQLPSRPSIKPFNTRIASLEANLHNVARISQKGPLTHLTYRFCPASPPTTKCPQAPPGVSHMPARAPSVFTHLRATPNLVIGPSGLSMCDMHKLDLGCWIRYVKLESCLNLRRIRVTRSINWPSGPTHTL
jgi:hypothetical protein